MKNDWLDRRKMRTDYWLPKNNNLGVKDDMQYFRDKLFKALNFPKNKTPKSL
jgi:hypothetical protein